MVVGDTKEFQNWWEREPHSRQGKRKIHTFQVAGGGLGEFRDESKDQQLEAEGPALLALLPRVKMKLLYPSLSRLPVGLEPLWKLEWASCCFASSEGIRGQFQRGDHSCGTILQMPLPSLFSKHLHHCGEKVRLPHFINYFLSAPRRVLKMGKSVNSASLTKVLIVLDIRSQILGTPFSPGQGIMSFFSLPR